MGNESFMMSKSIHIRLPKATGDYKTYCKPTMFQQIIYQLVKDADHIASWHISQLVIKFPGSKLTILADIAHLSSITWHMLAGNSSLPSQTIFTSASCTYPSGVKITNCGGTYLQQFG